MPDVVSSDQGMEDLVSSVQEMVATVAVVGSCVVVVIATVVVGSCIVVVIATAVVGSCVVVVGACVVVSLGSGADVGAAVGADAVGAEHQR